ncbi:MAG: beta-glucosidase, partial [Firmicutes bacterium]|nr:beta-glucosidase [Bacillota bacterium]
LAPNGTLLASTFDTDMTKEVMSVIGGELEPHGLDALLGPGMNIHRHPLCGRNFEYFSEDPYLTGKIAAAFCRGVSAFGGAATPKHFAANGRETRRFECNAVMSERVAREIYLRGFEILIRECEVRSIMTSYNLINGIHATSNYDLLTVILRGEWGYGGFVMTDWGAHMNADESSPSGCYNTAEMVRAGGDIYMVTPDTEKYEDDMQSALDTGSLTRDDIAAAAGRLIEFILTARKNKKS